MKGRILIRPRAAQDIVDQAVYIADNNVDAATRFIDSVELTLQVLADLPHLGAKRSFEHPELAGVRMKPVQSFPMHLLFYRELEGGIELIRLLHAHRDIPDVLNEDA